MLSEFCLCLHLLDRCSTNEQSRLPARAAEERKRFVTAAAERARAHAYHPARVPSSVAGRPWFSV